MSRSNFEAHRISGHSMQLIVNWLLAVVHPVKVRLIDGDHIGQTLVSIIDTQEKQLNKRNTYFWSMVFQVSVHAHRVLHSFKENLFPHSSHRCSLIL